VAQAEEAELPVKASYNGKHNSEKAKTETKLKAK